MKSKFLGALVVGALAFSVACSKSDKKSSSSTIVRALPASSDGDWTVSESDNKDLAKDSELRLETKDGKQFLVMGGKSIKFDTHSDAFGNSIQGFELSDGSIATIVSRAFDAKGVETIELQIHNKTQHVVSADETDVSELDMEGSDEFVAGSKIKIQRKEVKPAPAAEVKSDDTCDEEEGC